MVIIQTNILGIAREEDTSLYNCCFPDVLFVNRVNECMKAELGFKSIFITILMLWGKRGNVEFTQRLGTCQQKLGVNLTFNLFPL